VDADGGLYLLVFAVVEGEIGAAWHWFISYIHELIPTVHQDRRITFISDQHKGILNALKDGWPTPYTHRYCLRRIRANFQKEFNGKKLHILLWQASCASDPELYMVKRAEPKTACEDADSWIENHLQGKEYQWVLSKDGAYRFGVMTTNASVSFNGVLKGSQDLLI